MYGLKNLVLGEAAAANPFDKIKTLLNTLQSNITNTFITIFIIGIIICAAMAWRGSEENAPRFQKGLMMCIAGLVIFVLGPIIVTWVKSLLA
ncbi:TrbC/VirB2 family protein [Bacillus sp. 1P06AnD]|uniref:TrbC/VirB2 family protein n=1 Tax=Bacillus sp. 1P06AnD TaxID=3132208 RepID=UPI0039A353C6